MSILIACALFFATRQFFEALVAFSVTLPFLGIAGLVGWRQMKTPNPARVAEALERVRAMPWPQFSALIADAFRRDGYEALASTASAADFELHKNGYVTLLNCKRWKVAQTGIGPLRELATAQEQKAARDCIYVSAGDFTANAHAFAQEHGIRLVHGAGLTQLVGAMDWPRAS